MKMEIFRDYDLEMVYIVKTMRNEHKTKEQLMHELAESRLRISDLETSQVVYMQREEALKETGEILQALINATRETLLLIDNEGTVLLANEVVAQRLGKSVRELTGTCLYDHFPPDVARLRKEQFDRVSLTGEPMHFEDIREGMFFDIYCYPVFDKGGKASRIAIFAHEITKRKQAERKLIESEERYRVAIEYSNDGVALLRGDQHIYVNKKFLEIFGYDSPDEVIGKPHELTVHPDDLPMVIEYNRKRQRGEPVPSNYEFKGIRKDGTPIFLDISGARTIFRGEPVTLVYFRDITERKQAEEKIHASEMRYRRLFEAAKDGILIIDAETGRVEDVSPFTVDMLGYPRDELLGRQVWEIEFFKNTVLTEATFLELRDSGKIYYDNLQLATKDGWNIIAELVGNVYLVNQKRVAQFNIHNISDLKWAEEMLKQEKETFFSILENHPFGVALLGHDRTYEYINPAFTGITGYTLDDISTSRDWFMKAFPDPDYRHYVYSLWVNNLDRIKEREEEPVTLKVICKDKTEKIINFISIQLRGDKYIITYWDVTKEKYAEEEREKLIFELQKALSEVKTLSGLLPICASCKKIRNDKGYWEQIEDYVQDHSEAEFSHGICPECGERLYPEYYKKK
ncbi:MAG: PAS domain S-box protein [Proteobacteria bacterium]|nr:PAS domain S-box protein [Pseudomonadota bacterium]